MSDEYEKLYARVARRIDPVDPRRDLVDIPILSAKVGREKAAAKRRASDLRDRYKREQARARIAARNSATGRVVAAEIDASIALDKKVRAVQVASRRADAEVEAWEALYDSVRTRSFVLRDITELRTHELAVDPGTIATIRANKKRRSTK